MSGKIPRFTFQDSLTVLTTVISIYIYSFSILLDKPVRFKTSKTIQIRRKNAKNLKKLFTFYFKLRSSGQFLARLSNFLLSFADKLKNCRTLKIIFVIDSQFVQIPFKNHLCCFHSISVIQQKIVNKTKLRGELSSTWPVSV